MEFSRPEYWSGQTFPSLGDLPKLGTTQIYCLLVLEVRSSEWTGRMAFPLEVLGENLYPYLFQFLEAAWMFYSIFKLSSIASANFSLSLTLILLPPSFPYKDLYDYIGPIRKNQDNPGSAPTNSLAYSHCKVRFAITYWQGVRMQTSFGGEEGHYSVCHTLCKQLSFPSLWKFLH